MRDQIDLRPGRLCRPSMSSVSRLIGMAAIVTIMMTTAVVAIPTAATSAEPVPTAVDVDIVEEGLWVTYSNGCIESRAWRVPAGGTDEQVEVPSGRVCGGSDQGAGSTGRYHLPRVISGPRTLINGETVVALVPVAEGRGYWQITSAGRVIAGGSAPSLGDLSAFTLNAPIVAASPTESGRGYYMLSADGGVFSFGDAAFYGSVQGLVDRYVGLGELADDHITAPIVTLATTPAGYWLVAADGAVYPFGDAAYHGSIQDSINTGNQLAGVVRDWLLTPHVAEGALSAKEALAQPVIGIVPSSGGAGYQMVASDGGIFNFGASQFHGSLAGRATAPAVASDVVESRAGYVILTEDGAVHEFGLVGRESGTTDQLPTVRLPTALDADECRPMGEQGLPVRHSAAPSIGTLDVGVLFVEFDDYRANQALWPMADLHAHLRLVEGYFTASSNGMLEVSLHPADDWLSIGPWSVRHQVDLGQTLTGLGSDTLLESVLGQAEGRFDFTNDGLGLDALVMVFPPSLFYSTSPLSGLDTNMGGGSVGPVIWINTRGPRDEHYTEQFDWWPNVAHELLHVVGLDDWADFEAHEAGPAEWRTANFGLMGFETPWPATELEGWSSGRLTLFDGQTRLDDYYIFPTQWANEMLAWHRWRLGWLEPTQVVCLAFGDAVFDLWSVARADGNIAMAAMKLSDSQFLILEDRARIGYDADELFETADGEVSLYFRRLDSEGILAYVVDITRPNGKLPIRVFGEDSHLVAGEDWILSPGEWRTEELADGSSIRLDVSNGSNGTNRVTISTAQWQLGS